MASGNGSPFSDRSLPRYRVTSPSRSSRFSPVARRVRLSLYVCCCLTTCAGKTMRCWPPSSRFGFPSVDGATPAHSGSAQCGSCLGSVITIARSKAAELARARSVTPNVHADRRARQNVRLGTALARASAWGVLLDAAYASNSPSGLRHAFRVLPANLRRKAGAESRARSTMP